jgi:hypothetical protein
MADSSAIDNLFGRHRSAAVHSLWPWQREVLAAYAEVVGDAAVELPTGTGKTLIGLLAGESFRETTGQSVAYLAGNKQLAQQIERQARELGFAVVRFQGSKETWEPRDVRNFNFGKAIGVMNYWNYFNAKPGVEPAGMLILDDVHLLEGPLRDLFTLTVRRSDPLCSTILKVIVQNCPYYSLADDVLNGMEPNRPAEMLVFPDSADIANEVRDIVDSALPEGSPPWWGWQRIRARLEVCCWLVSARGVTFTPYIPPTQTITHFSQVQRRLYLSATIGSVEDLQRRLGIPPLVKLTASAQPRQGERLVVMRPGTKTADPAHLIEELHLFLERHKKALWLCARGDTARAFEAGLVLSGLPGEVRRLEGDNGADEPFASEETGYLVAAGRYDGMDFPGDACRVEVMPEVPVATSDLEEFVSAYLRDAPFAEARLGQRVAQALGRCNRSENDRAVYVLTDPEFLGRFSQRRSLDGLSLDVRDDVYAALERSDRGFSVGLDEATAFLAGQDVDTPQAPPVAAGAKSAPATAGQEVSAMLALWREDYRRAAELSDRVAATLAQSHEHRAFWLALRALALRLAAAYGDQAAAPQAISAMRSAATAGSNSTYFTRLRLSEARLEGRAIPTQSELFDHVFVAWDRLIDRLGAHGPRFDRWVETLVEALGSDSHNVVASAIAQVGSEVLGLSTASRQAIKGEEDAYWDLSAPRRTLAFEVKLAPKSKKVTNGDVEQAEGAAKALESSRGSGVRGLLITPHSVIDETASARLDRIRVMRRDYFIEQVRRVLTSLREYRRGWSPDSKSRKARREAVQGELPQPDWLWKAIGDSTVWVEADSMGKNWGRGNR